MSQSPYFENMHRQVKSICERLSLLASIQAINRLLNCQKIDLRVHSRVPTALVMIPAPTAWENRLLELSLYIACSLDLRLLLWHHIQRISTQYRLDDLQNILHDVLGSKFK